MAEQLLKLFSKDIQKNLFPSSEFYKNSKLDGGINVKAATVEVPQSGALPTVNVNPSSFPLSVGARTDNTLTYAVDLLATDPIAIQDLNEIVTNYNKRADILSDHIKVLNKHAADRIAFSWAPTAAGQIIRTTGAADATALAPGATGTRKIVTLNDIIDIASMFDTDDVSEDDRYMLVDARMYKQLLKIDAFINVDYVNNKPTVSGQVGEIFGMKVFKRSSAVNFTTAAVKKQLTAATAVTDNLGILAWSPSYVRRGEGSAKVYMDVDKPTYLGTVLNAAVRAGGTFGRVDQKGVYALVQEA